MSKGFEINDVAMKTSEALWTETAATATITGALWTEITTIATITEAVWTKTATITTMSEGLGIETVIEDKTNAYINVVI